MLSRKLSILQRRRTATRIGLGAIGHDRASPSFHLGSRITYRVSLRYSVPVGPGKQEEYAGQDKPNRPQEVPNDRDVYGRFKPGQFEGPDEYASSRDHP